MTKGFEGKIVVVTGGSDGIGLATAQGFAAQGATVYVTGRRQERLDEAVALIGSGAVGIQGDVGNPDDVDRLYARIRQDHGRLDIVFANAGISESAALGEIDDAHVDRVLTTNIKGTIHTVQKALPLMTAGGSVILASSVAGSMGFGALSIYSATKAAIRSFARTWTTDLKPRGIRVNVVSPGMVTTPAMQSYLTANAGAKEAMTQMIPFGHMGDPEDVAKAVLFLASDAASYVAGHELFVDGGVMAV